MWGYYFFRFFSISDNQNSLLGLTQSKKANSDNENIPVVNSNINCGTSPHFIKEVE